MPLTPIATRSSLTSANNSLTEGPFIVSVAIRLASMGRQVSSAMKNKYLENTSGTLLPSFQRKALDFIRARLPEKSLETAKVYVLPPIPFVPFQGLRVPVGRSDRRVVILSGKIAGA